MWEAEREKPHIYIYDGDVTLEPPSLKMAVVSGVRTFLGLHRSVILQQSFGVVKVPLGSTCLSRRLCNAPSRVSDPPLENPENQSLLDNLNIMGVDLKKVRQRQPGVLRKNFTNEQGLAKFLKGKGASSKAIASIISRYPRAITRSVDHLVQRWELWRNIFASDEEIVNVLYRSPESFFRSSDNAKMEKNIAFLTSLGLNTKDLHRLLRTAPRTFSNSWELNKQMVVLLGDICQELGGKNPEQFVKAVIARNLYLLIRSTKRVRTNVYSLRESLKLNNSELLALLQGSGAEILDLSTEYMKRNFNNLLQKMASLGCQEADIKKLIISYPTILFIGPDTLNTKLDCLLKGGITVQQVLEKPKVLEYSTQNITGRIEELHKLGYDFKKNGINILDSSRKRFIARIERLNGSTDE